MKTPIRWAGSKFKTLHLLRSYWPGNNANYIEPFAGSACLFFDIEPQRAVLGDLNADLIRTFRALRDQPETVITILKSMSISKRSYYLARAKNQDEMSTAEAAARFLFLNKYCFNGLYRTNQKGRFNVPYGHKLRREKIDFSLLRGAALLLKRSTLVNEDFETTLDQARNGDFVYLDPPYAINSSRLFSEYLPNSFSTDDLERLDRSLIALDKRGVTFVISYADDALVRGLFSRWHTRRTQVRRNIAGFAGHRRVANEIVASNRRLGQL